MRRCEQATRGVVCISPEAALAAKISIRQHVFKHRVQPIRNVGSVEMPKENALVEALSLASGLPPRRRRRPRRADAVVEARDHTEELIAEIPRH